ncbi:unnamed protein product [Clonostachys rosea f. rosea IK726]|uniref:Uncharacterized protein n=1 Tax=Clonostachys rosea f. rosea IK726 TaxID=1349383 RepID=A0ACA9U8I2_BIOOC|nr:unnamed protein product [Clonostachys rosea f. rosea IK726]
MQQLVHAGLDRTQKQVSIKRGIDEGLQAVQAIRAMVDKAVQAAPEAAVAWVGVCLGLEILSNPVTESRDNRKGIAYVLSRMEWYWNLVSLLLDENKARSSATGLQVQLRKHIVQLYEKLLSYQMKSVCLYAAIGQQSSEGICSNLTTGLASSGDSGSRGCCAKRYGTIQYGREQGTIPETHRHRQHYEMNLQDIHSAIQD